MPEYEVIQGSPIFAHTPQEPGPSGAPIVGGAAPQGGVDLTQHPVAQAAAGAVPDFQFPAVRPNTTPGSWPGVQSFGDIRENPDLDIDLSSGAPFAVRTLLQRAKNPAEAKAALASQYQPRDYGQDREGRWWVRQNGRRTLVLPADGTWGAAISHVGADLAAQAAPLTGMVTGAAAGAGIAGVPGAVIGAGLGGIGGEALDDVAKWASGIFRQTPNQVAGNLAEQGTIGAVSEMIGPAARGIKNAIQRNVFGVTPASQQITDELLQAGYRPQYSQMLPGSKILPMHQNLWNRLIGPWGEKENQQIHLQRFSRVMEQAGISEAEVKAAMARSKLGEEVVDGGPIGERIGQIYEANVGNARSDILAGQAQASQILKNAETVRRQWGAARADNLGELFQEGVEAARSDFGRVMNTQYSHWNALTGAKPVVNAEGPVLAARQVIESHGARVVTDPATGNKIIVPRNEAVPLPPIPAIIQDLATRDVGQGLSISDAHQLRVKLHEQMRALAGTGNLTPGLRWHDYKTIEGAVDGSFSALESTRGPVGQAARGLAATNKQYAEGIRQFNSDVIRKIVSDSAAGRPANPEVIADLLLTEGRNAQTRQVLKVLPEGTRKEVRRAYMNGLFRDSDIVDPVTGDMAFSAKKMLRFLDSDRAETMRAAGFTEKDIAGLKRFSQWANANNITIRAEDTRAIQSAMQTVENIEPGKVQDLLRDVIGRKMLLRNFVESDPAAAILNMSNPQMRDGVVDYLLQPGKTARLEEAARLLGTNSPEWVELQRVATLRLLQDVMTEHPNGTAKVISDNFMRNLNRYSPSQKALLFPNHLDDDFIKIMKETNFMFPEGRDGKFGISLAAASIGLHAGLPFTKAAVAADAAIVSSFLASWIMTRQPVMRFLAMEATTDRTRARQLGAMFRMIALEEMTAGPGSGKAARPDLFNLPPDYRKE